MKLDDFFQKHLIRTGLFPHKESYSSLEEELKSGVSLVDCFVDDPFPFVELAVKEGYHIDTIIWWDRVHMDIGSNIGAGGYRDPRDSENYYFAEITFLDKHFCEPTSAEAYMEYMKTVFSAYPENDLYPSFRLEKA